MNNNMNFRGFALRIVDNFFRHKILYLLPAVFLGALGLFFASNADEYRSQGVVFVESETFLSSLTEVRSEGFSYEAPSEVAIGQLYGLLSTDSFAAAVLERSEAEDRLRYPGELDVDLFARVRDSISADYGGENILTISAFAVDPSVARNLAAATIETFVQWQIDADTAESLLAERFVEDLVVLYESELLESTENLTAWIAANPGPNVITDRPVDEQLMVASMQAAVLSAEERLGEAASKVEDARLATAQAESDIRQGFAVVDEPQMPLTPQNGLMELLLGGMTFAFVGVIMSAAVITFTSASDTTLRFPSEIEELLGVDLLAVVPKVNPR